MINEKSILKSRMFWINAIVFLASVLNEIIPLIQDRTLSRSALIYAVAMILLRKATKDPVYIKRTKKTQSRR